MTATDPDRAPTPADAPGRTSGIAPAVGPWSCVGPAWSAPLALPLCRIGIGWPIAALALARRGSLRARPGRRGSDGRRDLPGGGCERAWRVAAGVAALGVGRRGGGRAAGWLVALCLLAALPLGSYALAGGRTWLGLGRGARRLGRRQLHGLGWAARRRSRGWTGRGGGRRRAGRRLGGSRAGWPASPSGWCSWSSSASLFRAADPAFDDLVAGWTDAISVWDRARGPCSAVVLVTRRPWVRPTWSWPDAGRRAPEPARRAPALGPAEWAVPLGMLDALFARVRVGAGHRAVRRRGVRARPGRAGLRGLRPRRLRRARVVTVLTLGVVAVLAVLAGRTHPTRGRARSGCSAARSAASPWSSSPRR